VHSDNNNINNINKRKTASMKTRHRHHLYFQFQENQEMNNAVSHAILYLYVHSIEWLQRNHQQLPNHIKSIDIEIAKIHQSSHKETFETFRNIPLPENHVKGGYIQLNVTELVASWFQNHNKSHGIAVKIMAANAAPKLLNKIVSLDSANIITVSIRIFSFTISFCVQKHSESTPKQDAKKDVGTNLYLHVLARLITKCARLACSLLSAAIISGAICSHVCVCVCLILLQQ